MSISLFISYHDPRREDRLIPIASDDTFQRYWRPTCRTLGLRWVSRFQSGWTLTALDLPPILEELRLLRQHLPESDLPAEPLHHLLARISVLRRELHEIERLADASAYIGSVFQAPHAESVRRRTPSISYPYPAIARSATLRDVLSPKTSSMPTALDNPLPGRTASSESSTKNTAPWQERMADWFLNRSLRPFGQPSFEDL